MSDIDPASVMAEHAPLPSDMQRGMTWCPTCYTRDFEPCEPYRLAEALAAEQAKVTRLWATWEPYDQDDEGLVPWRLQRDMRAALADQPEKAT